MIIRNDELSEAKLNACLLVSPLAEMLYQARAYWQGVTVPWSALTAEQKSHFRDEVETLIKERTNGDLRQR